MKSKTIYLHAGHYKTGSSYLQQVFLQNRERLLTEHGVYYPTVARMQNNKEKLRVTSGNGFMLYEDPKAWKEATGQAQSYLFSREQIFHEFIDAKNRSVLDTLRKELDAKEIEILFFIRNPVQYAMSSYQQQVKGHGMVEDIDDFIRKYRMKVVHDFITLMAGEPGVNLTVYNYSNVRDKLVDIVDDWLRLGGSSASWNVPSSPINRSLTWGEFQIQQAINASLPKEMGNLFYRTLVQGYPEAEAAQIIPSVEAQEVFLENNRMYIEGINALIPVDQQYDQRSIPFQPPVEDGLSFSPKHLHVLGEAICKLVEKTASNNITSDKLKFGGKESRIGLRGRKEIDMSRVELCLHIMFLCVRHPVALLRKLSISNFRRFCLAIGKRNPG